MATTKTTQSKKNSTVRHTRAIQYDRTKRPNSMPLAPQVSEELTQIVHPHTLGQVAHFHRLGLRERVLTLPVMVALVLTMIWRQIGSATELVRLLRQEGFLWCSPVQVTEAALSQRLRTFPAELFQRVLEGLRLLEDDSLGGGGSRGSGRVSFADLRLVWRGRNYYASGGAEKEIAAGATVGAIQSAVTESAFGFIRED